MLVPLSPTGNRFYYFLVYYSKALFSANIRKCVYIALFAYISSTKCSILYILLLLSFSHLMHLGTHFFINV